jgi:hypothetical protein
MAVWQYGSISTMLHMAVRQYLITTVWQYGSVSTMLEQYLNNASYGSTAVSHHHSMAVWQCLNNA